MEAQVCSAIASSIWSAYKGHQSSLMGGTTIQDVLVDCAVSLFHDQSVPEVAMVGPMKRLTRVCVLCDGKARTGGGRVGQASGN